MTKKVSMNILTAIMIILLIFSSNKAIALEKNTHRDINEYIAHIPIDGFSLDAYLKDHLGFEDGIQEEIESNEKQQVWQWIGQGGKFEDNFPRMRNHFHDPVTDEGLMIGDSALFWAR